MRLKRSSTRTIEIVYCPSKYLKKNGCALFEFHNRANLDGPISSGRNFRGQRNRFVEVFAIHQVIAAELLFRLGKGTIGGQGLSVAYSHVRPRARRPKRA